MKYSPHNYQTYATDFIVGHPEAAVFLDMGLGKSVITLTALLDLCLDRFEIAKVLVIAPLRVATRYLDGRTAEMGPSQMLYLRHRHRQRFRAGGSAAGESPHLPDQPGKCILAD